MRRISDEYVLRQAQSKPNIDASYRCVFRCPQCVRQKTYTQNQIKRSFDIGVNELQKILDFYNTMNFCGQISDPIYHPQFLLFLKMCAEQNKFTKISTVGGGKDDNWWDEAFSYGVGKNAWYFGVDGIDEKSELYRVGSNFKEVWSRMLHGRDKGHNIVWQYIIFDFNIDDMDKAVEIAKQENFSLLFINTNRPFNPDNPYLRKNVNYNINGPQTKSPFKKQWYANITKQYHEWKKVH